MNKKSVVFLLAFILVSSLSLAQIKLPKLISDGVVLQRDTNVKIWGWASPNEEIQISFKKAKYNTQADAFGNWQIVLPPQKAGGPFSMELIGTNKISVNNILFGDVWICSGQSNMELTMDRLKDKYPKVIENSENSNIRQFLVPDKYSFTKAYQDVESGSWKQANPENLLNFSGVAYFFAKDLFEKYGVPIGLVNAALGGSPVESWMSEDALKKFPKSFNELQKFKDTAYIAAIEKSDKLRQTDWYTRLNNTDNGFKNDNEWFLRETNDAYWEEMEVPGFWSNTTLGNVNGAVWFRKHITIPEHMIGNEAKLWLGRIVDQDHVYVNGEFVGTTGYQYPPRKYVVGNQLLKHGDNTITVRVINEHGKGGFILDKPYFLAVGKDTIDLQGKWKYKLGAIMKPLQGPMFVRWKPSGLYNKMISPLLNYNIKGAIWYQGESNAGNPDLYFDTFPAMINNWRADWKLGNFPFIYVQLANYMAETDQPTESNWAKLRQAQLQTLELPNTGMAVITDLGEWNDIHPLNKEDVGKRLAQEAYKLAYNESKVKLCPTPGKFHFKKKKVKIAFNYADSGLKAKDGMVLRYFEISKDGKTFHKAKAKISDDKVIVWNENISNPIAIRYAWADNPQKANLVSNDDLPVSPFEILK
jgi:sialate O-acetylesterase